VEWIGAGIRDRTEDLLIIGQGSILPLSSGVSIFNTLRESKPGNCPSFSLIVIPRAPLVATLDILLSQHRAPGSDCNLA
jgi:hypothetical protein